MAQQLTECRSIDGLPAQQLLTSLTRLYPWIVVLDADRRILWMSDGASRLFGRGGGGIGRDAREFLTRLPNPNQVFTLRSHLRNRSHLDGEPLSIDTESGESVPVEVSLLTVETDGPGGPLLVSVARPAAAPPGALLQAALEAVGDVVLALDASEVVCFANPAASALFGSRTPVRGSTLASLFRGAADDIRELIAHAGSGETRDVEVAQANGSRWLEARADRLEGQQGAVLCLRDVSDRRRASAELARANDELEHCVNALAHDLRSPLVALLGFSRLLRQDFEGVLDETGRHFLDRIEQAGRTMEGLIHDLLELSRIGQPGERPDLVDPRAVLIQLKAELKPRLDERGIRLHLPEEPPPLVTCDRTRLYQLFSNLIGNAIDHMGDVEAPEIEVSVRTCGEMHDITVRDNGRGIPAEHHERIFEVFQSLAPRSDGDRGTGIGLAVVKKIAETRGGRAWVESAPGAGSTFHVGLPVR